MKQLLDPNIEKTMVEMRLSEARIKVLILDENKKTNILILSLLCLNIITILLNIF